MKSMTPEVRQNMEALLAKAEAGLKGLPGVYDKTAVAALVTELTAAGARISDRPAWDSARMSFGGVKSSCTAGTAGAIRNWCVAVRKRLEENADA